MNILVTGGTGFIGSHLVEKLVKRNYSVRCLARKSSDITLLKNLGVEIHFGDLTKKETLKGVTNDIDVVFHLAAQMRKWGLQVKDYCKTNIDGTKNILDLSISEGVEQFIHCSTTTILEFSKNRPLNEDIEKYNTKDLYAKTKTEAEKIVLKNRDKIKSTIIYPDLVYGPRNLSYLPIFKAIKERKMKIIGKADNLHHPTFVSDLVAGFSLVLKNKKTYNERFILASDAITTLDLLTIIAEKLGVEISKVRIPLRLARMGAYFMGTAAKIFYFNPILNEAVIDFFENNYYYDTSKARKKLGFKPKISLEEGIEKTIEWYKLNNLL